MQNSSKEFQFYQVECATIKMRKVLVNFVSAILMQQDEFSEQSGP